VRDLIPPAIFGVAIAACATPRPPLPALPSAAIEAEPAAFRSGAPAVDPDVPFEPPDIVTETADNGLVVTRLRRPAQQMPTVALLFGSMSATDPMDAIVIEAIRREMNGNTPMECWVSSFKDAAGLGLLLDMTPEVADEVAETLSKTLSEPLPKEDVERAKIRIMRKRAKASRYGSGMVRTILRRERYGAEHAWGRDAIAVVEALAALDLDEIVEKARKRVQPDGTHLVFAGPDDVWGEFDVSRLRSWTGSAPDEAPATRVPPLRDEKKLRFHLLGASPDSTSLYAMHVGPGVTHEDYPAFATLCHLLGGMLSEAGREFRHEGGDSYGVHTHLYERREATECHWSGTFAPGKLSRAADQHVDQLERLREGDIDPLGLAAAKGRVLGARRRRFAQPRDLVQWTARQRAFGRSPEEVADLWSQTLEISERRLIRVARSAFDPERIDFVAFYGAAQDYYGLSARGAILRYEVERTDE